MNDLVDHIDTQSEAFKTNKMFLLTQLERMQSEHKALKCHASHDLAPDAEENTHDVRTRLQLLLDPHQPFLEIGALAAWGTDQPLGGGAVAGIGVVAGRLVVIFANDQQIKGGALNVYAYKKWQRALNIALRHQLPYISLVQSAGYDLDLEKQANTSGLVMPHFGSSGREFYLMCKLSQAKIPTICMVFGSCTAGGAYQPALSDYTIFVKNAAKVYLAGPPLVKMATGEEKTHEALGGACMHAAESGLADYLAEDDLDAIQQCRALVDQVSNPFKSVHNQYLDPKQNIDDLLGWLDPELKYGVNMGALLSRVLDQDSWQAYKPRYGESLLCGWGTVLGHKVAIITNNGNITTKAAQKGASFIQLVNQHAVPIVFIHNNTGFMVGEAAEKSGIIKAGAAFIKAMSNSSVPHISLMVGASYGAGTYAMCGPGFAPNFTFMWPLAKCNVMGPAQISGVMAMIKAAKNKQASDHVDCSAIETKAKYQEQALVLASEVVVDGVIDPRDTRSLLGFLMMVLAQQPIEGNTDMGAFRW